MVETRIAPRYRVLKAATIEFGGMTIDCTVRDISITGAALEVPSQFGIPDKFTLIVSDDGLNLPCHIAWRSGYRIGVAFDQAASGGPAPGATAAARKLGTPSPGPNRHPSIFVSA
jgi:hypothetical protein